MDRLLEGYRAFKAAASPPLASYAHLLPPLPKGLSVPKLLAAGYPLAGDLWDGVLIAVLLTAARVALAVLVLEPLGRLCMKHKYYYKVKARPIPAIDAVLRKTKVPMLHEKQVLAKQLGMAVADVDEYMRHWRNAERESVALHKFVEVSWKFLVHVAVTGYGLAYIATQPYARDLNLCWANYPLVPLPQKTYWYYMCEFAIYIHESIYLGIETKRKDFKEYVVHHIATLTLISGSYVNNFIPIGGLVMVVHDVADSLLELAKLFNYVSNVRPWAQVITDTLFVCFAVAFFLSRNVVFPFYLIRHTYTAPYALVPQVARPLTVLNVFLTVLECLHIMWFSIIVRMAVKMVREGAATKDDRSDDESYLETSIVQHKSSPSSAAVDNGTGTGSDSGNGNGSGGRSKKDQ